MYLSPTILLTSYILTAASDDENQEDLLGSLIPSIKADESEFDQPVNHVFLMVAIIEILTTLVGFGICIRCFLR